MPTIAQRVFKIEQDIQVIRQHLILPRTVMPDVSYLRRALLEGMDLSHYGIRPVKLTPNGKPLWSTTSDVALCLSVDEALAKQGFCATMDSPTKVYIEPWR